MDRRTTIAVLFLAPLLGAAVAVFVSGAGPDLGSVEEGRARSPGATPAPSPSPDASILPTEGTAASTILVEDFDMLPTGGEVPEWNPTGGVTLDVAVLPTSVDRSARLTAEGAGMVCRPLRHKIASLTADFMMEPLPSERVSVLTVELTGEHAVTLTVSADGAQLTDSSEQIDLEARAWYRWSVARADGSFEIALSEVDGADLGSAEVEAPDAAAERFCISTEAPTRLYLNSLTVEGH